MGLGISFLAFGAWTLFPDRAEAPAGRRGWGALLATAVIFFLAEMGDKTQHATVALAARFGTPTAVTAGTTLRMLAADGIAVFVGARLTKIVPMTAIRRVAAGLFFFFGMLAIVRALR